MPATKPEFDRTSLLTVLDEDIKVGGEYLRAEVSRRQAVGRDRAGSTGCQRHTIRVVCADDEVSIERQGFNEPFEGRKDIVEGNVEVRMVKLDVSNDSGLRFEVEKRSITLVGLGDKEVGASDHDVAPNIVQLTTDECGRVLTQSLKNVGRHARGRGLPVAAGDGHAPASREDTGEGSGSGHHRDRASLSLEKFGVCGWDSSRDHHLIGISDLMCSVSDIHRYAHILESSGVWRLFEVRTGDDVPTLV